MMGGPMMGGAALIGVLMMLGFAFAVIAGLTWLVRSTTSRSQPSTSAFTDSTHLDALRHRYAAGLITTEQLEAAMREVKRSAEPQPLLTATSGAGSELDQLQIELRRLQEQAVEAEIQAQRASPDEVQVRVYQETKQGALFRAQAVQGRIASLRDKQA